MYVSRSLSPLPDKLMTTTLFFISILSKTEKAWAVSIAGIIPSSQLNSIPAFIASSSSTLIYIPLFESER